MVWIKPIDQVEETLRYNGVLVLVDVSGRKLRFYGYKKDQATLNKLVDSVRDRGEEMVTFLTARARAKGET